MKIILPLFLLALLSACGDRQVNYIARVKLHYLVMEDIYNEDKVKDMLFDAEERNLDSLRKQSRRLFLSGVDAFRNKKNPAEAIKDFKYSLLCLPDAKTYYELGDALMQDAKYARDYAEARDAYQLALALDFSPRTLLFYKLACASNMSRNDDHSHQYEVRENLLKAFNEGFADTSAMMHDKYLASFVRSDLFSSFQQEIQTSLISNKPDELFDLYIASFPKPLEQNFVITPEEVALPDHRKSISYDFVKFVPEMENSSFGRDVSNDFIFVANVGESPFYNAVIYSSVSFYGDLLQPVYTKLVTYNKEGGIIAAKLFAGQFSAEKIKCGKVKNSHITITDYKRHWQQPITSVAPEDNKVTKYEEVARATFVINDDGTIREESVPAEFKDSLMLVKQ